MELSLCKCSQCFPSTRILKEYYNATKTSHWIRFGQRNHMIKAPFWKFFSSTLKIKAGFFKSLRIEECLRRAPFSWRIEVDGKPNRGNKAAFSNVWGVGWKIWHKLWIETSGFSSKLCESNVELSFTHSVYVYIEGHFRHRTKHSSVTVQLRG